MEHVDAVRASGIEITCVLADSGYGDGVEFREALAARGLHYFVGVSKTTKVVLDASTNGPPSSRRKGAGQAKQAESLEEIAKRAPASA